MGGVCGFLRILIVKSDGTGFGIRNGWEFTDDVTFFVRVDSADMLVDFTFWNKYASKGDTFHAREFPVAPLHLVGLDYNTELMGYCGNVYWNTLDDSDVVMLVCFRDACRFVDTMVVPVRERGKFRLADERESDLICRLIFSSMKRVFGVSVEDKLNDTRVYRKFVKWCVEHELDYLL